jgi:hypothetical protein
MSKRLLIVAFAHLLGALIIATSAAYVRVALPFPNSPPTAVADSYTVHGYTLIGSLLANDSDPDGYPISWHGVVVAPTHGTLSPTGNPAYKVHNPQPGYVGTDSFTYRIHDSFLNLSNTATITGAFQIHADRVMESLIKELRDIGHGTKRPLIVHGGTDSDENSD